MFQKGNKENEQESFPFPFQSPHKPIFPLYFAEQSEEHIYQGMNYLLD